MPNWTPGPWKLWGMQVCSAALSHGGNEKQPNDSDVVATTYQVDDGHPRTWDAHLIAAAPDLYAALARYLALPADPTEMQLADAEQQATAALAKARGETA